jgi:beta-lactamase regulating signal transducer with metallopeptidase domain
MSFFHQWSQPWQSWMLSATWQLALLVCIVAIVVALVPGSPRLRHALWLLVLLKVFLPPSLTAPWSLGRWIVIPLIEKTGRSTATLSLDPSSLLFAMIAWAAGCLLFWAVIAWRYSRLARIIRSAPPIDEGPVRIAFEQIGLELGLTNVPDLRSTELVTSPFLFGVLRPCVVLPEKQLCDLDPAELRAVLTHELVHFRHRDTWVGWLQVLAQSIFWFHPFVWWANRQLRHERECVCDEGVLRLSEISPQHYGESIVRVLTASRGRSLVAGSMVGVFERGAQLQNRLEDIMNYEPRKREFGWQSRLLLALLAILLLPMAPAAVQSAPGDAPYPSVIKTAPEVGAKDIDQSLKEITVTFDRDMDKRGMSWTGGGPEFPPIDDSRKAAWKDARTCVLPVKLEPGAFYRVGINSTSHKNFRGADGTPAPPSVIYFTTKGATAEVEGKLRVPKIVSLEPKNGATDVDPKTETLRVTFDVPMGEGMSWTGGGPSFPPTPEGKKASWSSDGLTCTVPAALEPGKDYQLGINSLNHINFQSKWGVPAAPVVYKFRTAERK